MKEHICSILEGLNRVHEGKSEMYVPVKKVLKKMDIDDSRVERVLDNHKVVVGVNVDISDLSDNEKIFLYNEVKDGLSDLEVDLAYRRFIYSGGSGSYSPANNNISIAKFIVIHRPWNWTGGGM